MDKNNLISSSLEKEIDYSTAVPVKSMKAVYKDIETARCDCGGKLFPTGPVTLKSPAGIEEKIRHKVMFVYCTNCAKESRRLYALDTTSRDYLAEQSRAHSENPRWGRLISGNPIDPEN